MDHKPVPFLAGNAFSKLLECPFRCWMSGDVRVNNPARSNLHDNERINQLEFRRHDNEEVAGNHGVGMIAHERHPTLGRIDGAPWFLRHITPYRPWRNLNSDLQKEFIGNTFLAPCRIVRGDFGDQFPNVVG